MSRFLFVTWDGGGKLTSTLGLARGLAARSHDVRMLGHQSIVERCGTHGWQFRAFRHTADLDSAIAFDTEEDEFTFLVHELMFSPAVAHDVAEELSREPADVLIADAMLLGALSAGQAASLPTVALFHTGVGLLRAGPFVDAVSPSLPLLNGLRNELGVAEVGTIAEVHDACRLSLVTSVHELEPPVPVPPNVRFIGPLADAPPLMAHTDVVDLDGNSSPLVVVSLSTGGQRQLEPMQRIVDALAALPVRALVTTGAAIDPADLVHGANTHVVRFVPHDQVFPNASLIVTHAGLGTVTRALQSGVPLLCMPMGRDQFYNAAQVDRLGAGSIIDAGAEPAAIGTAVTATLNDHTMRANSRSLAARLSHYGGTAEGVAELECICRP
jgi:UDP:flavonoid glycosyltransferase YjiC (YdhE family)